jgi:parallel beta-helix repeat protein
MYFYQSGIVTVTNNVIARNVSTCPGLMGGLQISESPARVINNTIANNTGDGIYLDNSPGAVTANNIIVNNSTDGIERDFADTTIYTIAYNDVYMNNINYRNVLTGTNDVSVNPSFVGSGPNLAAYYHILPTSPVSKTGSLAWAPAQDIDGEARILCASMGADQLNCVTNRLFLPLVIK